MDYAVDLRQGGTALGAGFLIAPCYVLTAEHCLRAMTAGDDHVLVLFDNELTVEGRVCQRDGSADLALVQLLEPELVPPTVPFPDLAKPGDLWHGLYRPSHNDPRLSGHVNLPSMWYDTEGGGRIEAVQLLTEQELGDYSGYSGSPVERTTPDRELAVLGMLIEQYPDRADPSRSANVLFAATIREVLVRFAQFRTEHLLRVLEGREEIVPGGGTVAATELHAGRAAAVGVAGRALPVLTATDSARTGVEVFLATGDALLARLNAWSAQDLIDPSQLSELQVHVAKSVIELALRKEAG
ncbi:S1 family peptidase [Streptomyces fulvoviolaceus]|uniref:S1 family peptidase n=1 Tax=Streptomyces fulvoviolaceus TaxID=285535 RepID=UPI0004C52C8C|nr:serine protease [Streptomyces fulvoviolaceus]